MAGKESEGRRRGVPPTYQAIIAGDTLAGDAPHRRHLVQAPYPSSVHSRRPAPPPKAVVIHNISVLQIGETPAQTLFLASFPATGDPTKDKSHVGPPPSIIGYPSDRSPVAIDPCCRRNLEEKF